jgi:hypothetical protein
MPRLRRTLAAQPAVLRARRALRVAAYKVAWVIATLGLLGSTLVELTQPHTSRFTFLFPLAWVALTVVFVRAVRRIRREGS